MPKKRSTKPGPARGKAAGPPASEPRELEGLFAALERAPGDRVTLLALADWYEERENARAAECLRWVAANGRAAYRHRHTDKLDHHHDTWKDGWYWWATDREKRGWGYPDSAVIPHRLWDKLGHTFNYDPLVFKEYPTVRGALEALIAAWAPDLVKARRKKSS
jgi:hypothetical protein